MSRKTLSIQPQYTIMLDSYNFALCVGEKIHFLRYIFKTFFTVRKIKRKITKSEMQLMFLSLSSRDVNYESYPSHCDIDMPPFVTVSK